MSAGFIFFLIGFVCGHTMPGYIGCAVTAGSLACIAATWYVEHSPDATFDILDDFAEPLVVRAFLPWAAGALIGALWLVL